MSERQKEAAFFYILFAICIILYVLGFTGASGGMMNPGSPVP